MALCKPLTPNISLNELEFGFHALCSSPNRNSDKGTSHIHNNTYFINLMKMIIINNLLQKILERYTHVFILILFFSKLSLSQQIIETEQDDYRIQLATLFCSGSYRNLVWLLYMYYYAVYEFWWVNLLFRIQMLHQAK